VSADVAARPQITDIDLFGALGFSTIKALDIGYHERADYLYDLNGANLDSVLDRQFDLVFDGGTMEHIFHVPNCFKNIFDSLKIGGCVFHMSPGNNHFDHGFYQFCPTLFYDYYRANGYTILDATIYSHLPEGGAWTFQPYTPRSLDAIAFGGLDARMYGTMLVARKTRRSTYDVVPQQGFYADLPRWVAVAPSLDTPLARVERILRAIARKLLGHWRPWRRKLRA